MSAFSGSKKQWSAKEIAFIIGYADYCIDQGADYLATVAGKLEQVLRGYGITSPSLQELKSRGITYLDPDVIPSEVLWELNHLRHAWGYAPLRANATASEPPLAVVDDSRLVKDDEADSFRARDQFASQTAIDLRSDTLRVEETPEPHCSKTSATDGVADQPSMSHLSTPSPVKPPRPAIKKKKAASAEDQNDLEYRPSPDRNNLVETSPGRAAANASEGPRDVTFPKGVAFPTKGALKTQEITPFERASSVIVIDGSSEGAQAVASSSQVAIPEAPARSGSKRNAEFMSDADNITLDTSYKRQETEELTLETVNEKIDACLSIIGSVINQRQDLPEETSEHLRQVMRTLKEPKSSIVENLIKDLDSQRSLKAKYRNMIQRLVEFVDLTGGTVFPKEPHQQEVNQTWTAFHDHIVSIVGPNNTTPKIGAASAAYLASCAENIAHGRIPDDQLNPYIESLSTLLRSPHAQQALFGALFCRLLFTAPEPMLHAMHSDGMMHLYDGILSSASATASGLAKVQEYDKVAAKLLFQDPVFQSVEITRRITVLKSHLQTMKDKLCQKSDIPSSKSPSKFAKGALEFKQQLLLSRKHYRIHYVRPGTSFDPRWMKAYRCTNDPVSDVKAAEKKVVLCIFPALNCEKGVAVTGDTKVEDVLVKNKRFFPMFQESVGFDTNMQLSKAAVLVSVDDDKKR